MLLTISPQFITTVRTGVGVKLREVGSGLIETLDIGTVNRVVLWYEKN